MTENANPIIKRANELRTNSEIMLREAKILTKKAESLLQEAREYGKKSEIALKTIKTLTLEAEIKENRKWKRNQS